MYLPLRFTSFLSFLLVFCFAQISMASPWISVGETRLKQHLHLLRDTGVISTQLSTWPIMWTDVNLALANIDESELSYAQQMAVKELKFEMRYQTKKEMKRSLDLALSSSRTLFRDFSAQEFEKGRISHSFDWDGESIAFKFQTNLTTDPGEDTVESQIYGSYFAGVLGNWVLGAGAIDRWWGAGHQSSLILGNNSQPIPAVFLNTKGTQEFETPWLSWLGGWQFTSFIGQLESSRHIPEAKITGMRFVFQPVDRLEIGLSRGMQWGGEGRSESLSTFFKSLTSQGENSSEQSGNQLAGYDLRYNFYQGAQLGSSLYAQLIGEDEAGYMPSKFLSLAGVETNVTLDSGNSLNVFLESMRTQAGSIGGKQSDTAYSHSVYKSGYRYRGRSLGASYDNDANIYAFGARYQLFEAAQAFGLVLSYLELNQYGGVGGNTVSAVPIELYAIDLSYERIIFNGQLTATMGYLSEVPALHEDDVDAFHVSTKWTYRF